MDVDFPCVTDLAGRQPQPISITSSPPCRFGDGARRCTRRGSGATLSAGPSPGEPVRPAARAPVRPTALSTCRLRALRMARLDSVGGEGSHARVRLVRVGRLQERASASIRLEEGDQRRVRPMHDGRRSRGGARRAGRSHAAHAGFQAAGGRLCRYLGSRSATTDFSFASRSPNRGRKVGEAKLGQDARGARGAKLDQRAKPGHSANSAENAKKEGKPAGLPSSSVRPD